ncbi:MAG: PqqD family protein [Acidobacteriota bacterium]
MNNPQFPIARKSGLVVQEVPDEVLVYDLDTNKAHCLNKTAAAVWRSCDGKNSVSDIAKNIQAELGSTVSDDLVWLAIDQLSENALLENELQSQFAGQSRREVLKKIGFASIVAVPVIASLVAPNNALAATSCACVNPGACLTQTTCPSTVNCNGSGICAP